MLFCIMFATSTDSVVFALESTRFHLLVGTSYGINRIINESGDGVM